MNTQLYEELTIRPTMNAIPFCDQPVLFMKVWNTNFESRCVGAVAGTVINMTTNEISVVYNEIVATVGSVFP